MRVLIVVGTRPEAIKMMPVLRELKSRSAIAAALCVTAQHRQLLDKVLRPFGITPDYDFDIMRPNQTLNWLTRTILERLDPVLESFSPDWVLVQGDTTTTLAAALAAFHYRVRIGHVEAGLRTGDLSRPWPEEMNRRCVDQMADLLFAPTVLARGNLLAERAVPERIVVTGNTAIDALLHAVAAIGSDARLASDCAAQLSFLDGRRRVILVTGHRRESFGEGLARICAALSLLAARGDVEIVYPVHPNPNVLDPVRALLGGQPAIHLIEPLDYLPFVALMQRAHIIISDSGGIQEEAPSLRKPVLVTRDKSERPEGIAAGAVKLVGTDPERIANEAARLLDSPADYARAQVASNPYGDGKAASRIVDALLRPPPRAAGSD
jgi:UDP-N-acetylglucosamine 2-epimerase (non-hydrolysing)